MNQTRILIVVAVLAVVGLALWWCSPPPARTPEPGGDAQEAPVPNMRIAVVPTVDDRFVQGPCCVVPSSGLAGLPYVLRQAANGAPRRVEGGAALDVPVFFGSMSHVPGELGARTTLLLYGEIVTQTPMRVVAVGPAELAHGTEFVRAGLTRLVPRERCAFLGANARDAQGDALLDLYAVTDSEGHLCLFTAVLADSAAAELADRGSDVQVSDPAEALRTVLEDARARVDSLDKELTTTVALVHGTVEEAQALAAAVPGWRLVLASGDSLLPLLDPLRVGGDAPTTVASPGRGMRHALFVEAPGERAALPHVESIRIGNALRSGIGGTELDPIVDMLMERELPALFRDAVEGGRPPASGGGYVGAQRCAECHGDVVKRHDRSPHARLTLFLRSSPYGRNVTCLQCHATGAAHAGGYTGQEDFSDMAGVSCEACHGPGGAHAANPERGWGMEGLLDGCVRCHLPERSPGFSPEEAWEEIGHGRR